MSFHRKPLSIPFQIYHVCISERIQYGKIAAMLHTNEELKFTEIVNKHTDKKSIEGLTNLLFQYSIEFPILVDSIVKRLTDLKINTEHLVAVFDKGNNSEDNIVLALSRMHIIASAKSEQAEPLLEIPVNEFRYLYTNYKGHEIFGYRTKQTFFGNEFATIVTSNQATYTLQKESYESQKAKILEKLADLKRRLESDRGKQRSKSSVEQEIGDIILKDFRTIIGLKMIMKRNVKRASVKR